MQPETPAAGSLEAALPAGCIGACPGCSHRRLSSAQSTAQKQAYLARTLVPWAHRLGSVQGAAADSRWAYRQRCTLHCQWRDGRWHAGMMRRDRLIAIPDCPVHGERVRRALAAILPRLPAAAGFRLHYYVQAGAQITLVLKQPTRPSLDWLDGELEHHLRQIGIEGLWLQLYPSAGHHKFSKRGWHLLWGQPRSSTNAGLIYGPESFQQAIGGLHQTALVEAEQHLFARGDSDIIDLYCGIGASLRHWRRRASRCLGVELNGEAVECARLNAPDAQILRGACDQRRPQIGAWRQARPHAPLGVYVNPPRSGLDDGLAGWIGKTLQADAVAYLSCSAGTLARDLAQFEASGFSVQQLHAYDFFPQTHHVEVLALLEAENRSGRFPAEPGSPAD